MMIQESAIFVLVILMTVQSIIWVWSAPGVPFVNSYLLAWKRTGIVLMHFMGLQPGRERALAIAAWIAIVLSIPGMLLTALIVGR